MAVVYLGLGSNLGDTEKNLNAAIKEINDRIGSIQSQSDFIVTAPWGFESSNPFLNAVICVQTDLSPFSLLHATQKIERELGRTKKTTTHYEDRLIDIDILLYEDMRIDTRELTIPHPLMTRRDFVMKPLLQIMAQDHIHFLPKDDSAESCGQPDKGHGKDHVCESPQQHTANR